VRAGGGPRLCMEEGGAGMGMKNTPDQPILNPVLHRDALLAGGQERLPDGSFANALIGELDNKGFLVTSTEELFQWARTGSLWWMTFGLACCAGEMIHVNMPRYDMERFGVATCARLRQAVVTGVASTVRNRMD